MDLTTLNRVKSVLSRSDWFGGLPASTLDQFARAGNLVRLVPGQIHSLYPRPGGCAIVVSGLLRVYVPSPEGKEFEFARLAPGDGHGLITLFGAAPTGAASCALGETEVLVVPKAKFLAILDRSPGLWPHFARVMADRARTYLQMLEGRLAIPLPIRVLRQLDSLCMAAPARRSERSVKLDLSQQALSQMLRGSRSRINQELRKLERAGVVKCGYRSIQVLDPEQLRSLASPNPFRG